MKVAVGIYGPKAWTIDRTYVDRLRATFPLVEFVQANSDAELAEALRDADVTFSSVVREDAFRGAKNLKWIHASAAGVGATLFPALVESDVILTNSKGVMPEWMADHVLSVILAWQRGLHVALRRQTERVWAQDEIAAWQRPSLSDTRVLVVGQGSIGTRVMEKCGALGMMTTGITRRGGFGTGPMEVLPEGLPEHDVVVITVPHTKETNRLFDRGMLARMLPGSLLVNVARGKIVDEAALIEGLRAGRPGCAALDVFEHEPLDPASPLWTMENVILTPHTAGFGHGFWDGLVRCFSDNLERWLVGRPLENIVDKRAGY